MPIFFNILSILFKEHEGGLPYPCDTCDKAFIDQDKLNMHKKIVHEKRYDHFCEFCVSIIIDYFKFLVFCYSHCENVQSFRAKHSQTFID